MAVRDECADAALEVHVETRAYIDDAKYRLEIMSRAIRNRWISVIVEMGRDDDDFASTTIDEFVLAFERAKREAENAYVRLPDAVAILRSSVDDAESAATHPDDDVNVRRVNAAITSIVGLNALVDACRNAYDDVVFAATHMARAGASIDLDVITSIVKLGPIGLMDADRISSATNAVDAHTRGVAKVKLLDATMARR